MNRFERPQINNQSKQALSIMLRQRHPPFMPGNQAANPGQFNNMQQQQQQQQRNQQLQQQQHQQSQIAQNQQQHQQYGKKNDSSFNSCFR